MDQARHGRHHRIRGFLGLLYITAFTFAALYAPQPLLSAVHGEYPGLSASTVTLLMSVTILPLSIAPLFYGAFLSSVSARRLLIACVTVLGLAGTGIFLSRSFAVLLFFRLAQGLVIPAILTCVMAHISAKFKGTELQRALAVYIGMTILGGLMGRTLGGCIASLLHWRAALLSISLGLLPGIPLLLRLKSRSRVRFAHVDPSEFLAILRTPGVPRLLLIDSCGFFVFAALANCLPFRLAELGEGISEWRIALMYLGYGVGVFIAFGSSRIMRLFGGEIRTIRVGVCLYLASLPGLLWGDMTVVFLTMCLICTGQFMEHSISPGLINRMAPLDKGAVNGLYLSCYYMGGALGSYLPGLMYTTRGWTAFVIFLMCSLLLSIAATLGLERFTPGR